MQKTTRILTAVLLAAILVFSLSLTVLADDDGDSESSGSSSQTNTITNTENGSQNVIQNVNVDVDVEIEGAGGSESSGGSPSGAVQNRDTLLRYCDVTGTAITSHDWVHVYSQSSIFSKILTTLKTREQSVEIVGRAETTSHRIWYKVKLPSGIIGYIQDKYLLFRNLNNPCTADELQAGAVGMPYPTPGPDGAQTVQGVLPAGVTVEVTYVPQVIYVPEITYVPMVVYVTPEPETAAPADSSAEVVPESTPAPET